MSSAKKNDHRPNVSQRQALEIVRKHFKSSVSVQLELNAYRDRNFLLKDVDSTNFVLKITNADDSTDTKHIEAQHNLVQYLNHNGIRCPLPIKLATGVFYLQEKFETQHTYIVRLLTYVPGTTLSTFPNKELYIKAGKYLGKLTKLLGEYENVTDYVKTHKDIWMLEEAPKILQLLHLVKNEGRKRKITKIIAEFQARVLDKGGFIKQVIHGDFNDHNVIVDKEGDNVIGVIDFSNFCYTYRIFDIGIALCYIIMLAENNLEYGGYLLKGYEEIIKLREEEKKVLRLCVLVRACQSVVNGLYFHSLDEENKYLLSSQERGWDLIDVLESYSDDEVLRVWNYLEACKL